MKTMENTFDEEAKFKFKHLPLFAVSMDLTDYPLRPRTAPGALLKSALRSLE